MSEVKITLTTLFELLKREKDREELQVLDPQFFNDVKQYLNTKKNLLESSSDTFSSETEKIRSQIQGILRIIKELYDRREKKIVMLALNKSRTGNKIIDTSSFLEPEIELFNDVQKILYKHRIEILKPVFSKKNEQPIQTNKEIKLFFRKDISEFITPNKEKIGPFKEGETVSLPEEIALILINQGLARKAEQ